MSQLIIGSLPCLDNLFVTLLLCDETTAEVLGNLVNGRLCIFNQSLLLSGTVISEIDTVMAALVEYL